MSDMFFLEKKSAKTLDFESWQTYNSAKSFVFRGQTIWSRDLYHRVSLLLVNEILFGSDSSDSDLAIRRSTLCERSVHVDIVSW